MAAAARAASPIFHVMLSVVLGLMTLIRMRRLPERFELGPDSSRALLIFVGRSRLIAARVAVAPLPIHRGGFAYEPTLSIPARPEPLPIEPARTAVLVVDI